MSFGAEGPRIVVPPPGPRSRELAHTLGAFEAPGVNTLPRGEPEQASVAWAEACGANVRDLDGNVFVDLTSGFGVAAVGHRHPRVVAAVREQAGRLLHGLGDVHPHPLRAELARKLALLAPFPSMAPEVEPQVHFAISGSEAVEIALKTALAATHRPGVVAFDPSYHGLTLGALAATSRPLFRDPFAPHIHSYVRRFPYGEIPPELHRLLDQGGIGAVIVEPVGGREGVLVPPEGWLSGLRDLCDCTGTLLIADEIFTGFGRTGHLFAVSREGVAPDLLCCGKALAGGLPLAAVLGRRSLMKVWETPGEALHTATFVANPLACAAALAALDVLLEERLPERAGRLGALLQERLATWPGRFSTQVREVRGRGLLAGIDFHTSAQAKGFVAGGLARGVLLLAGGPEGRVAQIVPPLNIDQGLLGSALALLEEALAGSPPAPPTS